MSRNLTTSTNTPTIIEVPSTAGFSAGDLVYYNGSTGDYGQPVVPTLASWGGNVNTAATAGNGLFGSESINANPLGIRAGSTNGKFAAALIAAFTSSTGTAGAFTITVTSNTGIVVGQAVTGLGIAAGATVSIIAGTTITLSVANSGAVSGNVTFYTGNIAQAWVDPGNSNTFYFQIVTAAQVSVVAPTQITSSFPNTTIGTSGVIALTGGGFVVYWLPSTTIYPVYAIYNNAGTVVTAATQDSSGVLSGANYPGIQGTALANGGFALAYGNAAWSSLYLRAYGATGSGTYSWIAISGFQLLYTGLGIASRSDSSVCIIGPGSTTNTWGYAIYGSTGSAIVSLTTFTTVVGTGTPGGASVCCMLNDTFALCYTSEFTTAFLGVRLLPASNVLGSEISTIAVPNNQGTTGINYTNITATSLSNNGAGGFIVVSCLNVTLSATAYIIFNASGVSLSGTSGSSGLFKQINTTLNNGNAGGVSAIEIPSIGCINIYTPGEALNPLPYFTILSQVSTTTYNTLYVYPIQQNIGSVNATPIAYAPSGSIPAGAAFTGTPNTYPVTSTTGTVSKGPTLINGNNQSNGALACTSFPNGNFAIAYTNGNIFVNLYSANGTLLTTLSTGLTCNVTGQNFTQVRIMSLSSGKMALMLGTLSASTVLKLLLYSISGTTFTQIGTTQSLTVYSNGVNYASNISALTNDRYVISYATGVSTWNWAVYDNTNSQVAQAQWASTTIYSVSVTGNPAGGFALSGWVSTTNTTFSAWVNTSGNSFSQAGTNKLYNFSGTQVQVLNPVAVCSSQGKMWFPVGYSTSVLYATQFSANGTSNPSLVFGFTGNTSLTLSACSTLGVTGQGAPFLMYLNNITGTTDLISSDLNGATFDFTTLSVHTNTNYVCTCPSYGPNAVVCYLDTNSYPNFAIITPTNITLEYVPASSTTPSVAVPIYPTATTTTSPAITGTVLIGVAVTSAPAGGTGQVQTSSSAQLNANYTSSTASAFDFTGNGVPGIKGTALGRNVTITGNT